MKRTLFQDAELEIFEERGRYFIIQDVGNHRPIMRKDEITKEDAEYASTDLDNYLKFRLQLQERLISQGIDPYRANMELPS